MAVFLADSVVGSEFQDELLFGSPTCAAWSWYGLLTIYSTAETKVLASLA